MKERAKRRKSVLNPYLLGIEHIITFIDSKGEIQTVYVSDSVYDEFNYFELQDLKEMNEYDRHIEHKEQTEEMLYQKTKNQHISLEDVVLQKILYEKLHEEIEKLPLIQKRRILKYYFEDMTLKEIAKEEGCSKVAVKYSINTALKKIYKKLKN